ncbi:MAG: hypothetical protein QOJ70_2435 [Acidobacteriota bacterium]|jgi:hypothetical protein|nr:hypothetical protein [Acidobacteriota bacterium]
MHGGRTIYFVLGEGAVVEPPSAVGGPAAAAPPQVSSLRFGRLFGKSRRMMPPEQGKALFDKLVTLGLCMNDPETYCQEPPPVNDEESSIPSGYTYLGQFIAHEITFDSTGDLLQDEMKPENLRTPQIDLDSLYGGEKGVADKPELYAPDGIKLKLGKTYLTVPPNNTFENDLPRDKANQENPKKALIGDERNDENLPLAQTHVAFIKFHNAVVERLKAEGHQDEGLFECARVQVIRHFQWIILKDYLPRIVDEDVLDCVMRHGLGWFRADGEDGLFMPLEFSAAAFRIGHSMVRRSYEWNALHCSEPLSRGAVTILELFQQTGFSRSPNGLGGHPRLPSDWVIDWRRFYDFAPLANIAPVAKLNHTSKLDTLLNFRLDKVVGFPDTKLDKMQKAIAVRNLLRGFYLALPTGEEVAQCIGEKPLTPEQVSDGPHRKLLEDPAFRGHTPLWYYVLKEAELSGGSRLGPVGSRIVAETLVGLVKQSRYSILDDPDWRPRFGARAPERFEMIDLLDFANVVNPIG